jgi:hypothetical protein
MSREMTRSRRDVLLPHLSERVKLESCPICRWAIEKDHEEALTMNAARARPRTSARAPTRVPSTEADVEEAAAVVGFALV